MGMQEERIFLIDFLSRLWTHYLLFYVAIGNIQNEILDILKAVSPILLPIHPFSWRWCHFLSSAELCHVSMWPLANIPGRRSGCCSTHLKPRESNSFSGVNNLSSDLEATSLVLALTVLLHYAPPCNIVYCDRKIPFSATQLLCFGSS